MSATLILDDPEEAFTTRQREMLGLLAERIHFEAIEADPRTAALALQEAIVRSAARKLGIWVHPGETVVAVGQRVRTKRG